MYKKKEWADYIADGYANRAMQEWHSKQPDRVQTCASPSTLLDCPRVVWLKYRHHVPPTHVMTWAKAQRLLLGRNFENQIATQFKDAGMLLHHWKDDIAGESDKFGMNITGAGRLEGTPDLLLRLGNRVAISDAKTSRADSFGYVPIKAQDIWKDYFWYKYRLQLTAYYLLCHDNWDWFANYSLPLPDSCHLFSFALDDGVVRREIMWRPTMADIETVKDQVRAWNEGYNSVEMPACTCHEFGGAPRKFCPYGVTEPGKNVCSTCCSDELIKLVKE